MKDAAVEGVAMTNREPLPPLFSLSPDVDANQHSLYCTVYTVHYIDSTRCTTTDRQTAASHLSSSSVLFTCHRRVSMRCHMNTRYDTVIL